MGQRFPTVATPGVQVKRLGQQERVGDIAAATFDPTINISGGLETQRTDIQAVRDLANQKGLTRFGQASLDRSQALTRDAVEGARGSQLQGLQTGLSRLAQSGGLGSGSRLQLASRAGEQGALAAQRARRQGSLDELGIFSQDASRQQELLTALPGLAGQANQLELAGQRALGQQGFQQAGLSQQVNLANQQSGIQQNQIAQQADQFNIQNLLRKDLFEADAANRTAGQELGISARQDLATQQLAAGAEQNKLNRLQQLGLQRSGQTESERIRQDQIRAGELARDIALGNQGQVLPSAALAPAAQGAAIPPPGQPSRTINKPRLPTQIR